MTLFGNKAGRRKLLWGQLLKISALIIPTTTASTSLAYLVFAERWNSLAAWLGLAGGFGIVLVIIGIHFFTPVRRLPFVR